MTREQVIRAYASHMGLITRKRGDVFILNERYGDKHRIGRYRSLPGLTRAIERYGDLSFRGRP